MSVTVELRDRRDAKTIICAVRADDAETHEVTRFLVSVPASLDEVPDGTDPTKVPSDIAKLAKLRARELASNFVGAVDKELGDA